MPLERDLDNHKTTKDQGYAGRETHAEFELDRCKNVAA